MRGFADRRDAGRRLAAALPPLERPVVLGLPRGGVPVAAEVARALNAPLDVFVVRKLGFPAQPELAMGAVSSHGVLVLNERVAEEVTPDVLDAVVRRETAEVEARERLFRGDRPPPALAGRTAVIVDDGLATGSTMRAAVEAARRLGPARVLAAVPVAPRDVAAAFRRAGNELVCLAEPPVFVAVGAWYRDFEPTTDAEVRALLDDLAVAEEAPDRGEHPAPEPA